MVASIQVAGAQQVKSVKAAGAAVDKAKVAAENPKKAAKPATWVKLGKAYLDAYAAPAGNGWVGASMQDMQLILTDEKPVSSDYVEINGQTYQVDSYETRDYYYNQSGMLAIIKVTKPVCEDALGGAFNAYVNAQAVDAKGSKKKDIVAGLQSVSGKYLQEAYDAYTFGDIAAASTLFEKCAAASAAEPLCAIDTNAVYNAGFTAWMVGDYARSKKFLLQSKELGFMGEEGEAYAKLADIADKEGDKDLQRAYLEEAFLAFPKSQAVLIGLINFYIASGEDTNNLFALLDVAKENEPNNPSFYYVEGNCHEKLGNEEAALASWRKCIEIAPGYEYGFIAEGIHFFNKALDIQEVANNEYDDRKYMALMEDFDVALKACMDPFEQAYKITKDDELKVNIAEYLKQITFRYRTESDEAMARYEFYNDIVTTRIPK